MSQRAPLSTQSDIARYPCGGNHFPKDHWKFLESMLQNPTDMVSDLIKMGIYKPQALDLLTS